MNNSFLTVKMKRLSLAGHACFISKIAICLFLFSQIIPAQYHFDSFTTADGLPGNTALGFQHNIRGEFYISTGGGNCYSRDDKFIPVPEADLPNQKRFYLAESGNLWTYDENGFRHRYFYISKIIQVASDER